MKIALIGYGKMGRLIEKLAIDQGDTISVKINTPHWSCQELEDADICIDFSHPDSVIKHVKQAAAMRKNIVVGTTGWTKHLDEVKSIVNISGIGLLYSPNFSIGVALFLKLIEDAAQLFDTFEEYDIGGWECHHAEKIDSPSGTAQAMLESLQKKLLQRKKIPQISSLRCGNFPGTHSLIFDSPVDTITVTHQARSREGFARGALSAADWLIGKSGFFTLEDLIKV